MRSLRIAAVLGLVFVLASGALAARKVYVCYYDLSGGQDTEITVMNLGDSDAAYTLRVFDQTGDVTYVDSDTLGGGAAKFYRLGDKIGHGDHDWGMVKLETDEENFFTLAAEYFSGDKLVSIDNVVEPLEAASPDVHYWYSIYYVDVGQASTGVILANPWWQEISTRISVYQQDGELLFQKKITLAANTAYYIDLEEEIGQGSYLWGAVDLWAEAPVLVACEYYSRGGSELEIDNVTQSYAIQRSQ